MTMRYSFGGDEHVFVEISEAMSLEAFFRALSVTNAIREEGLKGITEICPANASFQIKFDPDLIRPDDLLQEIRRLDEGRRQGIADAGDKDCGDSGAVPGSVDA